MKVVVQQFPTRSAMKHALALNISDRNARRVLKFDLKMHPYKILAKHYLCTRKRWKCNNRFRLFQPYFFSDEVHFHLFGGVDKQNFRYELKLILKNSMNVHYIALKVLFGVQARSQRYGLHIFFRKMATQSQSTVTPIDTYCQMLEDLVSPK